MISLLLRFYINLLIFCVAYERTPVLFIALQYTHIIYTTFMMQIIQLIGTFIN